MYNYWKLHEKQFVESFYPELQMWNKVPGENKKWKQDKIHGFIYWAGIIYMRLNHCVKLYILNYIS